MGRRSIGNGEFHPGGDFSAGGEFQPGGEFNSHLQSARALPQTATAVDQGLEHPSQVVKPVKLPLSRPAKSGLSAKHSIARRAVMAAAATARNAGAGEASVGHQGKPKDGDPSVTEKEERGRGCLMFSSASYQSLRT